MTTPHVSNLEEDSIHEDRFDIRFTVCLERVGDPPDTENFVTTIFELFQSPFIVPCDTVLQDVVEFLQTNVSDDYLSESGTQTLASEITSYHQERVQHETTNNSPRLIPLEVCFYADYDCGRLTPLFYVLENAPHHEDPQELEEAYRRAFLAQSLEETVTPWVPESCLIPASQEALALLKKIQMPNKEIKIELCSICLEKFDDDDEDVSATPCGHVYHTTCIVGWLQTGHMCPLCRYQVPTD